METVTVINLNKSDDERWIVRLFGEFWLEGLGKRLSEDVIRSEMLTKLLAYVLCHHNQEMSVQELTEALWPEDTSDNPAGALKNLMYRLRSLFKKTWGGDISFIHTGHGSYSWNKDVVLELDTEVFDAAIRKAKAEKDPEIQTGLLLQAVALYQGPFLPKLANEYWIITQSAYYQGLYLSAVKKLAALLEAAGRYEEMANCCSHALQFEALDEDIHTAFIRALIGQNKTKMALDHYKKARDILYENLGVAPSTELREIYEELLKQTHHQEMDLTAIERDLAEEESQGAFLCEYGVFRKTYRLEIRRSARLGISVYIALITVVPRDGDLDIGSQAYLDIINQGMDQLEEVLLHSLRSGDVISRYSGSQFIVLLPTCQYETAKMVMQRIENNYYKTGCNRGVKLHYSLDEMEETQRHA